MFDAVEQKDDAFIGGLSWRHPVVVWSNGSGWGCFVSRTRLVFCL